MEASILLQQLLAQRKSWVELEPADEGKPAKRVQITRPPEADVLQKFLRPSTTEEGKVGLFISNAEASSYVIGWEGITEADILGAGVGAESPAPFSPELWTALSADRFEWVRKVRDGVLDAILKHHEAKAAAAKNSQPS